MTDEEVWVDVVGYEGYYQVSNLGRVKRLPRYVDNKKGDRVSVRGGLLSPSYSAHGYPKVSLCLKGVSKGFLVHRLVAIAFLPNPEDLECVDHLNGIKYDNRLSNLEWVSKGTNNLRATITNGRRNRKQRRSGKPAINGEAVVHICRLIDLNILTYRQIADIYGVGEDTISSIASGRSWNTVTNRKAT